MPSEIPFLLNPVANLVNVRQQCQRAKIAFLY